MLKRGSSSLNVHSTLAAMLHAITREELFCKKKRQKNKKQDMFGMFLMNSPILQLALVHIDSNGV